MARKILVQLIDDLDGTIADEAVAFALDGVSYEIDLSSKNAGALRDALATYVNAGRRMGRTATPPKSRRATSTTSAMATSTMPTGRDNQAIREWANTQGLKVNDRGRVPASIVKKYRAAGSPQ